MERPDTRLKCDPGSARVRPEFKQECDINRIVGQYRRTGVFPEARQGQPSYGDFTEVDDYRTALHKVQAAQAAFAALPATLRARVDNDPGLFMQWLADPANVAEARQLGLFEPEKAQAPSAPAAPAAPPAVDPPK